MQLNKEQRALFNAGMPISVLNKIPGPQARGAGAKSPAKQQGAPRKDSRPHSDVFYSGQRLVVLVGSERRMIKII